MAGSRESGGGARTAFVLVVAALVAAIGATLLVIGLTAFGDASDTRTRADELRRAQPPLVEQTQAAERDADAPIGRAEKVAAAVSATAEAGDTLATSSNETSDLLSRAVGLANDGNLGGAHELYAGEGATSVEKLGAELARARAAVAAAQQAVADLQGVAG